MRQKKITSPQVSLFYFSIPPCVLSLLTVIIYYPSLHYPFLFDDIPNITHYFNIRHQSLSSLIPSTTRWISFWLNSLYYKISTFDQFLYRIGNVTLHTINGLLIFFLLLYGFSHLKKESFCKKYAFPISFLTALLFLLHPVQSQTVSYVIQGQLEGLAAFFVLCMTLCLLTLTHMHTRMAKRGITAFIIVLAFISCGSKEIAIISPALLILFDWFFIAQGNVQSLKTRLWLHVTIATIVISTYMYYLKPTFFTDIIGLNKTASNNLGNVITHDGNTLITPWPFFISQFKVLLHYIWIFIWPFNVSVEYDWVLVKHFFAADCILPLIILLTIAIILVLVLKKNRINSSAFGLLWFFVCLLPRSSIIPSAELLVDYKTYMASFGLLLFFAIGVIKLVTLLINKSTAITRISTHKPYLQLACLLILALPLGMMTIDRNTVWRSGLDFWGNILKNAPNKARAYNNYGVELTLLDKHTEAIPYFIKSIKLDDHYQDPYGNLSVAYLKNGKIDLAIQALQQSLSINPHYAEGYNNLGTLLMQKGDFVRAERAFKMAITIRPHYGKAYFNLGTIYYNNQQPEQAWEYIKKGCMQADCDNEYGFFLYGKLSLSLHKIDEAIDGLTKALKINSISQEALFNLGNAYVFAHNHEDAIKMYEKLIKHYPHDMRGWFNLGELYYLIDQPEKAIHYFTNVEPHKQHFPMLSLRMADCYIKLHSPHKAQQILDAYLTEPLAEDFKTLAKKMLLALEC